MFSTFDPATNAIITAATVNVYNPGTVTPISATIFDRLGNVLSNPLTSDASTGLVDFYLTVAQEVDVVVSKSSFTTRTYSNVPVLDDSSLELTALLTTTGDIIYASSNNSPVRLPIGSTGNIMYVNAGVPAYNANAVINSAGLGGFGVAIANNTNMGLGANITTSVSAAQAGLNVTTSMTAQANSDALYGLLIQPTFTPNSKTSLTATGISVVSLGGGTGVTNSYGLNVSTISTGTTLNCGVLISAASGATANASLAAFGDLVVGAGNGVSNNTTSTTGFLWINFCSGTPTGVPAMVAAGPFTGHVPVTYDSVNKKIWIYDGGWKGVVVS